MKRVKQARKALTIWAKRHKKHLKLISGAALGVIVLVQVLYPSSRLLPFSAVDGVKVGGWHKDDAVRQLDKEYQSVKVPIFFGDKASPQIEPGLGDVGVVAKNSERIDDMKYRWYWRLIPFSLLWAHATYDDHGPEYRRDDGALGKFIDRRLDGSCEVAPKNAAIKGEDGRLAIVPSEPGGACNIDDVRSALATVRPRLDAVEKVQIPVETIPADISDKQARSLIERIVERVEGGIALLEGEEEHHLPPEHIYSWISSIERGEVLDYEINPKKAADYLYEQFGDKVHRPAGLTKVTTRDFTELSRDEGEPGQALDVGSTSLQLTAYLKRQLTRPAVQVAPVEPEVEYTRRYTSTSTGLTALITHYAQDNPGTFGVSLVELTGKRRSADYNSDRVFHPASTYKLFIAYSTLKRVESGDFKWSDKVTGDRNLSTCFDDMIVKSDNPCAEKLLEKIGFSDITNEMEALGLRKTSFMGTQMESTAGDLTIFLTKLESGQMLKKDSRERLINAMHRNQYRQGIPAGASGQVADKVGFLSGLLHDAAIVDSPSGKYVLTIMSDGSTWNGIAELVRKIETLR